MGFVKFCFVLRCFCFLCFVFEVINTFFLSLLVAKSVGLKFEGYLEDDRADGFAMV